MPSSRVFADAQILAIAAKYPTPFFLYDVDVVRDRMRTLSDAFNGRAEIAMSLKANPNPNLIRRFLEDAQWFDVASIGEYYLAKIAGVPAEKIVFIGPGKTEEELAVVISAQIGLIAAESVEELCHIDRISRASGKRTDILLRINPNFRQSAAGLQMSGVASQFGISVDHLREALDLIKTLDHVSLKGIHVYLGSQILSVRALVNSFEHILSLAHLVEDLSGKPPAIIDLGGGFGIPYFAHESPLDMSELRAEIASLLAKHETWLGKHHCRLLIESGRFLFGESGVYVCSILYRKYSHGTPYVVLDGGSNFHSTLSGLGKIVRANFPMYSIGRDCSRSTDEGADPHEGGAGWTVAGPLCTPTDILARNVPLEHCSPGDLIVFEKSGAYGLTFSQEKFLSHTSISEILHERGKAELIKRRKSAADFAREYDVEGLGSSK